MFSTPAVAEVAPVYKFAPDNVRVPVPLFAMPPEPDPIAPVMAVLKPPLIVSVKVLFVIGPPKTRAPEVALHV
jgi:hypothetical protein